MQLTPTEVFKSFADDTRLRVALLLASAGELCVCELTESLQESQPKISRHLSLLRTNRCAVGSSPRAVGLLQFAS